MAAKHRPPTVFQEMVETIGERIALKLVAHFGGRDIQFPQSPPDDHPIIVAMGVEDGRALCDLMAGCMLYVPHGRRPRSVRAEVRALTRAGLDRVEIARRTGVSVRHVRRMRSGQPGDLASDTTEAPSASAPSAQRDLFDPD